MCANLYIVLSDRDFTKHYYAGAERVCVAQPFQYLPFRENHVSEHTASPYTERFTFTGKEKDSETGYTYHGARYYDADLMCSWFSVDPLSDKYPSMSPYNYCAWTRPAGGHEHRLIIINLVNNPVKLVDEDGRSISEFDETGKYLRTIKDNWLHNFLFGHRGIMKDRNGDVLRRFRFSDPRNDVNDLKAGAINKIIIVTDGSIKRMLNQSGAFQRDNTAPLSLHRYDNIKEKGIGGGDFDFSVHLNQEFQEASCTPTEPSPILFVVDNMAYNHSNFGNFLFGAAGCTMGLLKNELLLGAHYNSLFNPETNGYSPQFDSSDDQLCIKKGFSYAHSHKYHLLSWKASLGL